MVLSENSDNGRFFDYGHDLARDRDRGQTINKSLVKLILAILNSNGLWMLAAPFRFV
jgi:hypothetical protein